MRNKIEELIDILEESIHNEDFIDIAYEGIEKIEDENNAIDAIEPLLKLMEKYPDVDMGLPGPIVHFIERFYKNGYEEKLVESIKRCPVEHTLWMLNRIINDADIAKKNYYLNVLEEVINKNDLGAEVINVAKHFRNMHTSN